MSCNRCGTDWYGINPINREPLDMEPDLCPDCEEEGEDE
jgi:hypothetical protein